MKINSLVECVNGSFGAEAINLISCRPKPGKIYTIRGIKSYPKVNKTGVLLEEIVNEPILLSNLDGLFEPTFDIERFRELHEPNMNEIFEELVSTISE